MRVESGAEMGLGLALGALSELHGCGFTWAGMHARQPRHEPTSWAGRMTMNAVTNEGCTQLLSRHMVLPMAQCTHTCMHACVHARRHATLPTQAQPRSPVLHPTFLHCLPTPQAGALRSMHAEAPPGTRMGELVKQAMEQITPATPALVGGSL